MMLDATQRYADPLTKARLVGWHAALFPSGFSGFRKITVGAWRTPDDGVMQVVSGYAGKEKVHFEAPAAERLDKEMAVFTDWFNAPADIDPVLKAGIAHLWFVTLHPFGDGNGRIARAIADCALSRADNSLHRFYSMSSRIEQERKAYYYTVNIVIVSYKLYPPAIRNFYRRTHDGAYSLSCNPDRRRDPNA